MRINYTAVSYTLSVLSSLRRGLPSTGPDCLFRASREHKRCVMPRAHSESLESLPEDLKFLDTMDKTEGALAPPSNEGVLADAKAYSKQVSNLLDAAKEGDLFMVKNFLTSLPVDACHEVGTFVTVMDLVHSESVRSILLQSR